MNATGQFTPTSPPDSSRLVRWSWLMLPTMLLSGIVAGVFQFVLLSAAGLEGSEPLAEQGSPASLRSSSAVC
jgi:hypothetical protein